VWVARKLFILVFGRFTKEVMRMAKRGLSCTCNAPKLAAGVLSVAVGIYLIVLGWATQGLGQTFWSVLWYFLGVFAITLGNAIKSKALVCEIH